MSATEKPQLGDRVSVMVLPGWTRTGVVLETDYHPLGVDEAARVRFDDGPAIIGAEPESHWWGLRWVRKETTDE